MLRNRIGESAGKLWSALGKEKEFPLSNVHKLIGTDVSAAQQAIGWLAREDKLKFEKRGKNVYVSLVESEMEAYQKQISSTVSAS